MKKYLISGIPPSHGGVGYLMYELESLAIKNGYEVIYPIHTNESIRQKLFNPIFIIKEVSKRFYSKLKYLKKIKKIINSEVILIHPQTIGYKQFINLINLNKKIKVYVMDNSFFCIKSYNVLNGSECLKCLNNLDSCDKYCKPFPSKYEKQENLTYLKKYKKDSKKVSFYAQNTSQAKLIKKHFGNDTDVKVVGMKTGEKFESIVTNDEHKEYDIVFHGSNHEAKGIDYVIELAKLLPNLSLYIPSKLDNENLPKNITHENITWSTGLREIIVNAKLILNPSIWSAPVEGALLKSIYYNGNVAGVTTEYGFINDIPDNVLLKLSANIKLAKKQVEDFFINSQSYEAKSKVWLEQFFEKECNLSKLFEVLND